MTTLNDAQKAAIFTGVWWIVKWEARHGESVFVNTPFEILSDAVKFAQTEMRMDEGDVVHFVPSPTNSPPRLPSYQGDTDAG